MELKRNNKGITLIALVITIIVLLILAGISIATLTGNNGILTRAKDAKETTEYKSAEEKVNLAVIGAIAQDNGILKIPTLRTEVENSYSGTVEGNSFPVQVTIDGKTFTVDGDGNVTNYNKKSLEELKEIIEKEPNDCMIDENGNVFPNDKWYYEITGQDTASIISDEDNYCYENAYKGEITEDGKIMYEIPVYIKENDNIYIVNKIDANSYGLFGKYVGEFKNIEKVKEIKIPESITYIGNATFYDCKGLIKIDIPSSVTSFGDGKYTFYNCSSLVSIDLPEGVTEIGSQMFFECANLKNVNIPSTLTSIESGAFYGCESLNNVTFENKEGWTVKESDSLDPEISINVDDPAINVKNLTDTYHLYKWNRK